MLGLLLLQVLNAASICQVYANKYRFATLYDRNRRIPVYSAYKYQPGNGSRSDSWFVEPQEGHVYDFSLIHLFSCIEMTKNGVLTIRDVCSRVICFIPCILSTDTFSSYHFKLVNKDYRKDMQTEDSIIRQYNTSANEIGKNQAIDNDYMNLTNLDRGHLCPSSHQIDDDSRTATFTLTNIVPQDRTLNQHAWREYEEGMMQKSRGCTTTYVITGAVHGDTNVPSGRVNIPSHIWSAACCVKGKKPLRSWGAIAKNNENVVQNLTLVRLEKWLEKLYNGGVILFNNSCT
ncbi:PREDICTED: endonuclease domain-containing 1 protein-like [Sturnus vulgaris]|uniref:endonuclease domain-containing 1 protein-like n=1 Tax=Sturnus vulgaris TaxID=9172 RepID=UPI000719EDA9|nr:PREDICTED: endonuclease domain-containing 1 protein-like [Sturnus vulgaris]